MTKLVNFSIADIFTLINGALGFIAIFFLIREKIDISFNLILLSVLADGMDGIIARRMGHSGGHLDELADTISFCLAPSVMIYMISDLQIFFRLAICSIFCICGLIHLKRYYFGDKNYFMGIPTPSAALFMIILLYLKIGTVILFPATIIVSILMIISIPTNEVQFHACYLISSGHHQKKEWKVFPQYHFLLEERFQFSQLENELDQKSDWKQVRL